jgi:two-component system chemotaxis sensor kinase CheA
MDDLIAEFLTETNESLAELDLALVKLERTPNDSATLSLIFRLVHTIKGTCGFLGLPRLEHVAHAAENVLGRVRDKELSATTAVVSAVLAALDRIKLIVAGLAATGTEPAGDDTKLVAMLERASRGEAEAGAVAEEAVTGAGTGGVTGAGHGGGGRAAGASGRGPGDGRADDPRECGRSGGIDDAGG